MPEISIIVAIYNIEKFLTRCLDSIVSQTFRNFECILIDDGSSDSSPIICDNYCDKDKRFKVIHKTNAGLPQARKTGYDNSIGKFILFIDGDDWIESNMLELMLKKANQENADVVICGFYKDYFNGAKEISINNITKEKKKIMELFMTKPGYMNYYWNKLIRRDLFNNEINFPENVTLCEDLDVIFKVIFYAKNISNVSIPLYHYVQTNSSAMTKNITEKSYNSKMTVFEDLILFCTGKESFFDTEKIINFYKIYNRLPLIIYKNLRNIDLWENTYPESNKYIWNVPLRFDYKLISWLCSKKLYRIAFFLQDLKKNL